jgi:hypothetical protein
VGISDPPARIRTERLLPVNVALVQIGIETPDLAGWSWAEAAGFGQQA